MDNTTKTGPTDSKRPNPKEYYEVRHGWGKFGWTADRLKAAMKVAVMALGMWKKK